MLKYICRQSIGNQRQSLDKCQRYRLENASPRNADHPDDRTRNGRRQNSCLLIPSLGSQPIVGLWSLLLSALSKGSFSEAPITSRIQQ
ncbi:hypothetical protein BDV37DRAFT_238610 [Aspergillus pseudonomiae]|uniref:Uncharacterized protein n=1 Tax=Aspergillus pseudonomiae TaxID=1506151 RepID=A0A5N7DPS4_9EURO|nr:uncharacterized protein BDV37DRAFT_238610 [Aspergillus pseudonomiae]KAE8408416.1 hypothetical protein BDV37DRAFT_238610 [Aspergillus pseudonomiae]